MPTDEITEDDTFRVLARPSWQEMKRIHDAWWYSAKTSDDQRQRIPFMKKYGWTWLEFVKEGAQRGQHHY